MAMPSDLHDPWLVAVWPGMGNVALMAGAYLVERLSGLVTTEFSAEDLIEVESVEIKDGLITAGRGPRSLYYAWKDPSGKQDMLIFIGEAQPASGGYAFCHRLLNDAIERGVKRIFTFAAMATQLQPGSTPRVFGVVTRKKFLRELAGLDVEILRDGQISGLNGVLLAVGAERGLEGVCLLGEMPFFAINVPNPKASQAVLKVFARMAGIDLDLAPMAEQAEAMDHRLVQLLEKLQREAAEQDEAEEKFTIPDSAGEGDEEGGAGGGDDLDPQTRHRIEQFFEKVRRDRSKAVELKQELDRLGVFKNYENR